MKMALFKEENEDFRIEEVFSLRQEDTEEQTDMETNTVYSKKNVAICTDNRRRKSGKKKKPCPEKRVPRNTRLVKQKSATLINRRCPAEVSISKEQFLKLTQRILNLEARVGWLEACLNEKAVPSRPLTVDQSTSTDGSPPLEIKREFQQSRESPSSTHESNGDHSTSVNGHLDNFDFGALPVVSTTQTDHALNVQTRLDNVTPVNSIKHEPTNSQLDTGSTLDCDSLQFKEYPMCSPKSNTSQACPPEMSPFCLRLPETPTNAPDSNSHTRKSHVHGVILPDVILNHVSTEIENKLYLDSAGSDGRPRAEFFAAFLFKKLIPLPVYHNWAGSVNYDGSRGKNALPSNLRQVISDAVARKFHPTSHDWKLIRGKINELLRKKRLSFPLI